MVYFIISRINLPSCFTASSSRSPQCHAVLKRKKRVQLPEVENIFPGAMLMWCASAWVLSTPASSGSGSSRTFPVFISKNSIKFPEWFWHPPRIIRHVPKPIWLYGILWNNFSVSPELIRWPLLSELFRCLRKTFSGNFLSDSLSSIQQIDDP